MFHGETWRRHCTHWGSSIIKRVRSSPEPRRGVKQMMLLGGWIWRTLSRNVCLRDSETLVELWNSCCGIMLDCFKYLLQFNSYAEILVKLEEQCSQLFCGKAIHWVICWCQKWRLMGTIFDIVPAIQKVFICLVSSLLMNIFSIVLFLTRWGLGSRTDWGGTSIVVSG